MSPFNMEFKISAENIEDLISKDTTITEGEMILQPKKPDFLGDSQWEIRHGSKTNFYTMLDKDWVTKYQTRKATLQPQDFIKAIVREERKYDYDHELIGEHFYVVKVIDILPAEKQLDLPSEITTR